MDRPLPHNLEAETGVIGTILNNNQAADIALEILRLGDFYNTANSIIFNAITQLHSKGSAIDILTVRELLKDKIQDVGGVTNLSQIMSSYGPRSNIKEYSLIVKDKSDKRKIIKTANEMILQAYNEVETTKILNDTEDKILNINSYESSDISSAAEVTFNAFERIEENFRKGGGLTGLPTKIKSIDNMTGGLEEADYVIVAARPSMGKTAMMLELTKNVASQQKTVLVFSLEMTKEKLMNRMFSNITKIPLERIKTGELTSPEWEKLAQAVNYISQQKIFFDDKPAQTPNELRSKAKKLKLQHGLDLIVLDYIGKIQGQGENRNQELSKISGSLKDVAKELKVPIIVLCQLSRAPEGRSDHRPMLSDLRESGSIEQDADIVMMLYRDEYYNAESEDKNVLEVLFTKNRDGKTGTVKLFWDGNTQTIGELDYTYEGKYRKDMFKGGK